MIYQRSAVRKKSSTTCAIPQHVAVEGQGLRVVRADDGDMMNGRYRHAAPSHNANLFPLSSTRTNVMSVWKTCSSSDVSMSRR